MSAAHSTQPHSNGSLLLLLQVLHERQSSMDRRLQTIETIHMRGLWSKEEPDTSTATEQGIWFKLREAASNVIFIHKLVQLWKSGPWSVLGWLAFFVGKWLGVL